MAPSMRTRHLGLDPLAEVEAGSTQVVRISGIGDPEFQEPTNHAARHLYEKLGYVFQDASESELIGYFDLSPECST